MQNWKEKIKSIYTGEGLSSEESSLKIVSNISEAENGLSELEINFLTASQELEVQKNSYAQLLPYQLVQGNPKRLKEIQASIKSLNATLLEYSIQLTPILFLKDINVSNSDLILKLQNVLLNKQKDIQKASDLLKEKERIEFNKRKTILEKEKKIQNLKILKQIEQDKKNKLKQIEQDKKNIQLLAIKYIKQFQIEECPNCSEGKEWLICNNCKGSGSVGTSYMKTASYRVVCNNRQSNCGRCGGTGVFSDYRKIMTNECPAECIRGKVLNACHLCKGIEIISNKKKIAQEELMDLISLKKTVIMEIKQLLTVQY